MDDMNNELNSSSDFSFTPDFNPSLVMGGEEDDDNQEPGWSGRKRIKEVVSPKFESPDEIIYDDSDVEDREAKGEMNR